MAKIILENYEYLRKLVSNKATIPKILYVDGIDKFIHNNKKHNVKKLYKYSFRTFECDNCKNIFSIFELNGEIILYSSSNLLTCNEYIIKNIIE